MVPSDERPRRGAPRRGRAWPAARGLSLLALFAAARALVGLVAAEPARAAEPWRERSLADSARVASEMDSARRVFAANLDAIRRRDREAYLACYLDSPRLARAGPGGFTLGYESLAKSAGEGWPDHFEGLDLRLTPVGPGVVYGTYRYRVRYGADEQRGLSERLFVATPRGWKIVVEWTRSN